MQSDYRIKYQKIVLNLLAILVFTGYMFLALQGVKSYMPKEQFRVLLISKTLFFFVPVYLHNLILVPFFLDKRKNALYALLVLVLLLARGLVEIWVAEIQGVNTPINYVSFIASMLTDLILGAGVYFGYRRYIDLRNKKDLELSQQKMELEGLKAQLDQHFLFNALNTIYAYTKSDPPTATLVTQRLSQLLRYQLERSHLQKVTLTEELDFVGHYILLQEERFKEQLDIHFAVEGATAQLEIAPMLLIPLVENAFKHGDLGHKHAFVNIEATLEGGSLTFSISNSYDVQRGQKPVSLGLGLNNVKKRLALLYPKHRLEIKELDGEFTVELLIEL